MIARLLISSPIDKITEEIRQTLRSHIGSGNVNHPDILYFKTGEKLGIAEAKRIKEFFSLKPYSAKGRAVVIEEASVMTVEAQNALLKTLEELPENAVLILGTTSDANLLPTILSRCQITRIQNSESIIPGLAPRSGAGKNHTENIEELLAASITERFSYIERLKEKEEFLHSMVYYFREMLIQKITKDNTEFLQQLLQAEKWAKQNVNIRAILEYLMLVMPKVN